jgi:tight adherence protein B
VTVLAALCIGVACALLAGTWSGALRRRPTRRRARPAASTQRVWLQQAGVGLSPARFWLGSAGAGVFALLALVTITGSCFVALVPAVAVALMPRTFFARRRRTRLRAVQQVWPDGLRDLVASIASGRSLTQAVNELAAHGPAPLRDAFARFPDLARTLGTGSALAVVQEQLADPTSDRVIEVLLVAHNRGGAVVRSILEDLVDATTRDLKLLDELETEGLETRINARVVVLLPWLVLVALTARPGPFRAFYRSPGGAVTLALAGVLTLVGVVVLGRLGREQSEPRVFGPEPS